MEKVVGLYKKGDVVTVRKDLKPNNNPINCIGNDINEFTVYQSMLKLAGQKITIKNNYSSARPDFLYINEDNGCNVWHQDFFEETFKPLTESEAFEMLLAGTLSPDSYHKRVKDGEVE
jgi:hypothetical protein